MKDDRKGAWSLHVTRNWRLTFLIDVTAAAKVLGVSRPTLSSLLNGKADLSGDMALRIEKAFGVKMDTLMRMQASYDIALTRKRQSAIKVARYRPAAVYR
jgi:addiction module HigA family antidote